MDRRLKLLALGAVVGGAGCKSTQPAAPAAQLPGSGGMQARAFDPSKPPAGVPYAAAVPRPERKPNEPLKPETQAILADVDYKAALAQETTVGRDRLLDSARQKYTLALQGDPKHVGAAVGLARLYAATGDKSAAIQSMQAVLAQHPESHELAHKLATIEYQFGEYAGAGRDTERALQGDPKNRTYLKTLALCQAHQEQWDAAFGTLVNTQTMTQAEARYFLGRTLLDLGRGDEARVQIAESVRLDPNYELAAVTLRDLAGAKSVAGDGVVNVGYREGR